MNEFIIGTSAYATADHNLMQEAGFKWVRQGFTFPFKDKLDGSLTERYQQSKEAAIAWQEKGFKVMGITPLLGLESAQEGKMVWKQRSPEWMVDQTTGAFADQYRKTCAFMARDLQDLVTLWQIGNEWDARAFSGPLGLRRASELVFSGAQGLKEGNPDLTIGTNTAGISKSYYFYGRLYPDPRRELLDYCGVDQYFGSWQDGGPQTWDKHIEELADITQTKLLINEWGYSAFGELMNEQERKDSWLGAYYTGCRAHKWPFAWDKGHTPEVQGEYIRQAFEVFNKHRDRIIGMFLYRWEDQEKCWCGKSDCPAETRWGIVDLQGKPKPGYYAFKEGVEKYFK